jgi:nitrogen PTS system EIIA component
MQQQYGRLTVGQAAEYLHLSEKEVHRLVGHGALPGLRRRDSWIFTREDLDDWLTSHMHSLGDDHLQRIDAGPLAKTSESNGVQLAGGLVREELIDLSAEARTAASVLRKLAKVAENTWMVYDPTALIEALREREALCSTALPGGFALPHPRSRMPHLLGEPMVVFVRTAQPITFGAPHGEFTDLFFMILATTDTMHLQVLARLNLILRSEQTRASLREVETADDALALIGTLEAGLS